MNVRNALMGLLAVFMSSPALAQDNANALENPPDEDVAHGFDFGAAPAVPNAALMDASSVKPGNWFWVLNNDPVLLSGASAIAADARQASVLYVGGPGFVAVSRDSGKTWSSSLNFSDAENRTDAGVDPDSMSSDQKAEFLRNYLRELLEAEHDVSFVEYALDEITDEDLLNAADITDLEPFQDTTLNVDTDLTSVPYMGDGADGGIQLSEFDAFVHRYLRMIGAGADDDAAIPAAAASSSVWQIVSRPDQTYAVTPHAVYVTRDQGQNWETLLAPSPDEYILSLDARANDVIVGMTDGAVVSHDSGQTWVRADEGIDAAVYDVHFAGAVWWAVSTEGIYQTSDNGVSWHDIAAPIDPDETLLCIAPGTGGTLMALTTHALYFTGDGSTWNAIGQDLFVDENIKGLTVFDASLQRFVVQTDGRIFEFNNGWFIQNKGVKGEETGPVMISSDGQIQAMMATRSGVFMARDAVVLSESDIWKELNDTWAKEPTVQAVVDAAMAAHYLDGRLEAHWGLRSRLAWLLPTVDAYYNYRQTRTHLEQVTSDQKTYLKKYKFDYKHTTNSEFQIMALWKLNIGDAFSSDLRVLRLEELRHKRENLSNLVLSSLNKRRALQVTHALKRIDGEEMTPKDEIGYIVNMQEIEATLHYLTGGFYIPSLRENGAKPHS